LHKFFAVSVTDIIIESLKIFEFVLNLFESGQQLPLTQKSITNLSVNEYEKHESPYVSPDLKSELDLQPGTW
jgi:hypothetical protein